MTHKYDFTPTDMLRAVADILDSCANHRIAKSEAQIAVGIADYILDSVKENFEKGTYPSSADAYPKYLELINLWNYAKSKEG